MASRVAQYMGIVPIPLFLPPWTLDISSWSKPGNGWTWNRTCSVPQISIIPQNVSNSPTLDFMIGVMPNIEAPSVSYLNETTAPGVDYEIGTATFMFNRMCLLQQVPSYGNVYAEYSQPRIPGDYSSNIASVPNYSYVWQGQPSGPYTYGPILTPFAGVAIDGSPLRWWLNVPNSGSPLLPMGIGDQFNQGVHEFGLLTFGGSGSYPGVFGNIYVNNYNQADPIQDSVNRMFLGGNTHHGIQLAAFDLDPNNATDATLYDLSLSDPTVDSFFQNSLQYVQATPNGFIAAVIANHGGPTGQYAEYVYFDLDCLTYRLLKFYPQEATGQNELANQSLVWNVAIDTDGTVWFHAGNTATPNVILYSFTETINPFAQYPNMSFPPIGLPCWDTCPAHM